MDLENQFSAVKFDISYDSSEGERSSHDDDFNEFLQPGNDLELSDRLNSSDFFDSPEATFNVPEPRVKRQSFDKDKQKAKHQTVTAVESKGSKKRLQQAREKKNLIIKAAHREEDMPVVLRTRKSKTDCKQWQQSRSIERNSKPTPVTSPTNDCMCLPLRFDDGSRNVDGYQGLNCNGSENSQSHQANATAEGNAGENSTKEGDSDRKRFHKSLLQAIKSGRGGYKEREDRGHYEKGHLQRQYSDIIYNGRDKMNHESLFIALQAQRQNITKDECMDRIFDLRDRVPEKVKAVNEFVFTSAADNSSSLSMSELLSNPFGITSEYLDDVEDAIESVRGVLESVDIMNSLFPTQKSMKREYSMSASEEYQRRVRTLNMWFNNAVSLKLLIMGVGNRVGAMNLPSIAWPFCDAWDEEASQSRSVQVNTPSSVISSPVQESPSEGDDSPTSTVSGTANKKRVTFEMASPLSSSPANNYTDNRFNVLSSTSLFSTYSGSQMDLVANPTALYRPFTDRMLRKMGLMPMMTVGAPTFVKPVLKARYAIIMLELEPVKDNNCVLPAVVKHYDVMPLSPENDLVAQNALITSQESVDEDCVPYYEEFTRMNLPSLIPLYVFLVRYPLDLMHETLRIRLEQKIENPSLSILRPVVHECSEAAKVAMSVKQSYQFLLSPVSKKLNINDDMCERNIEKFNSDLNKILELYFEYVEYGINPLLKETTPMTLKSFLEEEWAFCKEICPFINGGMAEAGKRFCGLASLLFNSLLSELNQQLDEALFKCESVYNNPNEENDTDEPLANYVCGVDDVCTTAEYRQMLMQTCREIKSLFTQTKETTSKALGFAKLLRKDLEIAAEYKMIVSQKIFFQSLQSSGHVQVVTPHADAANYYMFVPAAIGNDSQAIAALLDVTGGRGDTSTESCSREGYLLLVNAGNKASIWNGDVIHVEPKAETSIVLSHIAVTGLFLIVSHSSQLHKHRKEFSSHANSTALLINEQTSCHQAIVEAWTDLRNNAYELALGVKHAIEHVENQLDSTDLTSLDSLTDQKNIKGTYKETLLQCYAFGFEFLQEFNRLTASGGPQKEKKDEILLSFANQWMKFVMSKCEPGKGTRPRWANPGFDFLAMVMEPTITRHLSDEEYEKMKKSVSECIQHVIGKVDVSKGYSPFLNNKKSSLSATTPTSTQRLISETERFGPTRRQMSTLSTTISIKSKMSSEPNTPQDRTDSCPVRYNSRDSTGSFVSSRSSFSSPVNLSPRSSIDKSAHLRANLEPPSFSISLLPRERAEIATRNVELHRDEVLRQKHVIGRVTEGQQRDVIRINIKKVNFKWQRGTKIGEGQFGVVYTAINCDTGQMMALKEIRFQPNDVQTIKSIADELKTFEGISHPNLVKYYGVEVHKEEMFIFMEYCNEGTLEELSKNGLTELLIRKYTRELVIAVEFLHSHNIVHRDIKGANIFMVSNDKLKLGDFGCSAKLKGHTTMPGEIVQFVGTAAYMAPEVIIQKGYGRAADIWSLGCVVLEMVTGKRPWHELENYHQIMFKVGMGNKPHTPDTFHQEGKDFLACCFEFEPDERSTANDLLAHIFIKVKL